MRVVEYSLLLILALILQTTWVYQLDVAAIRPDLIVLVLLYIALAAGSFQATILGFAVGFVQDIDMPDNLGLNALLKSTLGFAVGWARSRIRAESVQVLAVVIFAAVLVHDLAYYLGDSGIAWSDVPYFWLRYGLGRALYTTLVGALLYGCLQLRRRYLPV